MLKFLQEFSIKLRVKFGKASEIGTDVPYINLFSRLGSCTLAKVRINYAEKKVILFFSGASVDRTRVLFFADSICQSNSCRELAANVKASPVKNPTPLVRARKSLPTEPFFKVLSKNRDRKIFNGFLP